MNNRFLKQKLLRRSRDRDVRQDYGESSYSLLGDCSDSDSSENHLPLQSKPRSQNYIEHILQPGETLSSLALRYNCSVAQIKQCNNILRENEIFALRTVKIPVPAFSLLREGVAGVHGRHKITFDQSKQFDSLSDGNLPGASTSFTSESVSYKSDKSTVGPEDKLHRLSENGEEDGICNPLLTPVPQPLIPMTLVNTEPPDLELPQLQVRQKEPKGILQCSGADGGLSWLFLVVCTLVLGFAGPLIYIFLIYEHEKVLHNNTSLSNSSLKL